MFTGSPIMTSLGVRERILYLLTLARVFIGLCRHRRYEGLPFASIERMDDSWIGHSHDGTIVHCDTSCIASTTIMDSMLSHYHSHLEDIG